MDKECLSQEICLECNDKQKTCCIGSRVPLTISDIKNIKSEGFKFLDFAIIGYYSDKASKNNDLNEIWWKRSMIRINDKQAKINTRKKDNGSCFFLKEGEGCVLGDSRPLVCKIFPFWIRDGEVIYEDITNDCLFEKRKNTINDGIKHICETQHNIKKYYDEIRKDCIKNKHRHKRLIYALLKK